MVRACPVCKNEQQLTTLWGIETISCCPNCSLAYLSQLPTVEELAAMYSEEFFEGASAYHNYVADKSSIQVNFKKRIEILLRFSQGGQLFEAGCAHGFFLELAARYWDVQGIDISAGSIDYARDTLGLNATQGDLESHPPAANTFDVVAMWDTIEHLYDPVMAVETIAKSLKPGGFLALTTGDVNALLPRIQKKSWRLLHPTHLYYFSKQSLTRLLNDNGLSLVHFSYDRHYRSLSQMAQIITWHNSDSNWRKALLQQIQRLPFMDANIPLNLFDIMFVIAQKTP